MRIPWKATFRRLTTVVGLLLYLCFPKTLALTLSALPSKNASYVFWEQVQRLLSMLQSLTIRVSTVKTTTRTCTAFDSLKALASIFVDTTKCSFLLILCILPPTSKAYSSQLVVHIFGRQMIFNQTWCSWCCNHRGRQSNGFLVCLNCGIHNALCQSFDTLYT